MLIFCATSAFQAKQVLHPEMAGVFGIISKIIVFTIFAIFAKIVWNHFRPL